ncbi:V-type ATP synthase subunit E [Streptomyces sp. XD-27]|uniref:V-type ATP synthase subunit E n=1 Tax=Streptomyces sp. XD-27 TaxID=3062779 RepID=UPI0026F43B95|nr:V-type ATP synthase subunit E [Streptomyces sp. XD-27]WKX69014.1 V-type ATP synthase subunit E [Streptomyces sp. XD-27]
MSAPASDIEASLEPVRAELLRRARADARELLGRADREATDLLRRAGAQAEAVLAEARRQGREEGMRAARDVLARARRTARAHELAARRDAYEELRRRTAERVRGLRGSPEYPALLERLTRHARLLLGSGADVTEHPSGGVVAVAGGRRVDCTLDALAARALARLGAETEHLWAP